jgi:eukaryotic-like serine/threonine-protein kinase
MTPVHERLAAALADSYRLERELGQGGMAIVFLAEDRKHHRQVAVKILRAELAGMLGPERFLREIETVARLHHPHILPLYDSGQADGFLYYVMPLAEGESLRDRLRREKQLPLHDALQIAREVADALSYAHAHGVVHRDIKPENILLESGHAVVADFGIARAVSAAGSDRLTETGLSLGTPAYMSPEQAAGSQDLDGRSDLYSLGCVLYEMLAGEPPFTGATAASVIQQHIAVEPRSITQLRPAVPAGVAEAISRALAKTPADRFNPVGQFAEALGSVRETGRPPSPGAVAAPPRRFFGRAVRQWAVLGGVFVIVAAAVWALARGKAGPRPAAVGDAPRIVVLPFTNLGRPEDEYFADGVTEEVTSRIGATPGLGVIARTSAVTYRKSEKSVRQIGEELDVDYVLEGTVRWQRASNGPGRVRVTPQLIRVADETHLWADRYDAVLTDIFEVQSEIAEQVAAALGVTLLPRDTASVIPTRSAEAYDYFLRGQDYVSRGLEAEENVRTALGLFDRAVALDSAFALAHARRSYVHALLYWFRYDHTAARLAQVKQAADLALRLSPDLPEAHEALGYYYYWGHFDYDRALEQFRIAQRAQPNSSNLAVAIGAAERRRGNLEAGLREFERAVRLDPRSHTPALDLAYSYGILDRFAESERTWDRAIALAPDQARPYSLKTHFVLRGTGSAAAAGAVLEEGLRRVTANRGELELLLARVALVAGDYRAAVKRLTATEAPAVNFHEEFVPRAELFAQAHAAMGDAATARIYYDSAQMLVRQRLRESPNTGNLHSSLGIALAGLGQKDQAVREGRQAVELLPVGRDALDGPYRVRDLARIYVMVGEHEAAQDQLEALFALPGGNPLSAPLLRVDPVWAPLREHPRFRRLVEAE